MEAKKIDHIGIAVKSIEEHKKIYIDYLGFELEKMETLDDRGLKVAFLNAGNTRIELLESIDPNSTIAKFIEKKGEGIHHVAISVDSAQKGIEKAKEMDLKPLSETPREGAGGTKMVFLHPKSTKGVLVELVEGEH
ncbi:MAG: methylmalonyl-CoA epimerase [Kosmotoga sp.]|nr:MAG: methylmalonyl-CoA epimerase [Kosmotoga sp.]